MKSKNFSLVLICALLFSGLLSWAQADKQKHIQTQMIMASDDDTIFLDEGLINLTGTLSLEGKSNLVIKGKGMDKTILSFKGQTNGAEGIRISNASNIRLEDFSVEDAKGDGIKAMNVNGIVFKNIRAAWTGKPDKHNGSYALYPVMCNDVLIEGCIARGASDAGIYVGQSTHIIVRNSEAYENVAGIEIENSLYSEVYQNRAYNNAGGILVFDLPDLSIKKGGFCKVYDNIIEKNNHVNFAPKGNIVAKVPLGTGVLLLAANNVEVYKNKIINNRTVQTGIISYYLTENPIHDTAYYPYPTAISIHDNMYEKKLGRATMKGRMGKLFRMKLKFGRHVPDIVFDGIMDKNILVNGNYSDQQAIQICNNGNATWVNIDAENDFKKIIRSDLKISCRK
ncbi:MAG: parallel beta-helix domain-containing protein [Chitinophagaceae bacterium]